jgi:tungstate transport system substrate-binding protein
MDQSLSPRASRGSRRARPRPAPRRAGLARIASQVFLIGLASLAFGTAVAEPPRSLILATTTSVRDSGLLDALLPRFTAQTGIEVRVVAVGSGAALRMGREGNADLLLTHAPEAEAALVAEGIVRRRTPFMENYFVIAGPRADPAGIEAAASPEEALQRLARAKAPWVSRADDSGTHKREVSLFRSAGLDPDRGWEGVIRTGSGMGLSLQVAGEKRAYLLSDLGTFLAFEDRIGLVVLSKPADSLRNVYSILQLDGARFGGALWSEEAEALERYLIEPSVQAEIGAFGRDRFGRALFTPIAAEAR